MRLTSRRPARARWMRPQRASRTGAASNGSQTMTLQSLLSEGLALHYALPAVTFSLIGAEYLWGRLHGRQLYDRGETLSTLVIALGNQFFNGLLGGIALLPIVWVRSEERRVGKSVLVRVSLGCCRCV